jgi:hypothetical protein
MAAAPTPKAAADAEASAAASAAPPKAAAKVVQPAQAEPAANPATPTTAAPVAAPVQPTVVAAPSPVAAEEPGIAWPVTVEVINESGIPLSLLNSGLFIGPASSASIVLHDEDSARRIRQEVQESAAAIYIGDRVSFEFFPNIKG